MGDGRIGGVAVSEDQDLYDLLPRKRCDWTEAHTAHVWTDDLDGDSWICETVVLNSEGQ